MKIKHLVFFLFFTLAAAALTVYIKNDKLPRAPQKDDSVKLVHIYADTSSFPTLLQMVDLVKTNPNEPRFIFWKRSTTLNKKDPLFKNSYIVKFSPEVSLGKSLKKLQKGLTVFLNSYPKAEVIIHINKDQNPLVWLVLKTVPKDRIRHIHFYEESFGSTTFQIAGGLLNEEQAKRLLERETPPSHWGVNYALSLLPFYPSTVHLAFSDIILQKPHFKQLLAKAKAVEEVDFKKIAQELTEEQKKDLLRLNAIKETHLQAFSSGKPVILYTLGYFNGIRRQDQLQLNVLDKSLKGEMPFIPQPRKYTWLYKEHPWLTKDRFLKDSIRQHWPQVKPLPKEMPLEILFLAGYMPDKVFGYSSSLFFSLPAENILFYIQRPNDVYLPLLKQTGKLTDRQIFNLEDF